MKTANALKIRKKFDEVPELLDMGKNQILVTKVNKINILNRTTIFRG